jgi:hypothetical protein
MLDGTGKELLAGKQENVQKVLLHVYFCTENVLVAVVPPNDGHAPERYIWDDIFEESGKNILVFVKKDQLDKKLDMLCVA